MRSGRKRRTHRREPTERTEDVPVMQVNQKWGTDSRIYFADGDSGTSSDEENLVEEAIEEEKKHYASLHAENFKVFGNIRRFKQPIAVPESLDDIEKSVDRSQLSSLKKTIRGVIRDVTDASRALQDDFGKTEAEAARRQLLFSLVTNGCFYLHIVASGFRALHHPSLTHIAHIKELLGVDAAPIPDSDAEEEIHEEEEEEPAAEEEPTGHIPEQLKAVKPGQYRSVTRTIMTGKIAPPGNPGKRKNPRQRGRTNYRRAMDVHNKKHKQREMSRDGVYHGTLSGIDPNAKGSVNLRPAH